MPTTLKPSQLEEALLACIEAGRPSYIESEPGLGKTSVVAQLAKKLDCHLVDPSALTLESVDFRGIPWIQEMLHADPGTPSHLTRWAMPEFLHQSTSDPRRTILFFDDMAAAQLSVQIAMFQILLEKRSGPHQLRPDVIIIGAGNGASHGAGANRILSPIRTRLVQFNLKADLDDWERWAISTGINPTIPAFLRWRPDLLHNHSNSEQAFPCPRTWEFVSQLLNIKRDVDPFTQHAMIEGAVGAGAAVEYLAFLKLWQDLPKLDTILEGKGKAINVKSPGTKYAVTYALAARANMENYEFAQAWMEEHMAPEYLIMFVKAAHARESKFKDHAAWCGVKTPDGKSWVKGKEGAALRLAPQLL